VLLVHLLLLLGVVALVGYTAGHVYSGARAEAVRQASKVQSLLTRQTAEGIEAYYQSIFDTLELLRRAEAPAPEPGAQTPRVPRAARGLLAPSIWQQLRNRASDLILVDRDRLERYLSFPEESRQRATQIMERIRPWLAGVRDAGIGPLISLDGEACSVVAVPAREEGLQLFVVVVPIRNLDEHFLNSVHADRRMSAILLDDQMRVITAYDKQIVGLSMLEDGSDPSVSALAERYLKLGQPGTEVIEQPFSVGEHRFDSGLVSIQPINIRGKRWWLTIGSDLAEVDTVMADTFRGSLLTAILLIGSMGVILVSTAIQMIRNRARLERGRHDILKRELSQARQIQLAWLPDNDDDPAHIDLCAINQPASHISGDFYNWFDLQDGRVCAVIGDVTGHGMAAAFLMATTQLLVRMIMPRVKSPGECLEEVNRELCQQVFNGQFVTMLIVVLDREAGRMEVASAGHPPPLIGNGERFEPLKIEPQLVLAVDCQGTYPTQSFDLPSGASIVLYTDGVVDALNEQGERFRLDSLRTCLHGRCDNAEQLANRVLSTIQAFRGDQELADDLTLVTIQLEPVDDPTEAMASAI
jgi:sigma-B regulation protein RsbU (phosphoserine phosphatase)